MTRERRHPLEVEHDPRRRCRCTIRLQGTIYRCARGGRDRVHDGAHDANAVAADGYLVQW